MEERVCCLRLTPFEVEVLAKLLTFQLEAGHTEFRSLITRLSTLDDENDYPIIFTSDEQISRVIEDRLPLGRFINEDTSLDHTVYVGCDNIIGEAWTEQFDTYGECAAWVMGYIDSEGNPTMDIEMEEI